MCISKAFGSVESPCSYTPPVKKATALSYCINFLYSSFRCCNTGRVKKKSLYVIILAIILWSQDSSVFLSWEAAVRTSSQSMRAPNPRFLSADPGVSTPGYHCPNPFLEQFKNLAIWGQFPRFSSCPLNSFLHTLESSFHNQAYFLIRELQSRRFQSSC